jgi:hypothetical protein
MLFYKPVLISDNEGCAAQLLLRKIETLYKKINLYSQALIKKT